MANLTETTQWEAGIYQLETTDAVIGGADGVSNTQAKQLGNRTAFLKNAYDGVLTKSVAGSADVTLTEEEASHAIVILTGAITANINVIVPDVGSWLIANKTTGSYKVTVKTSAGAGVMATRGTPRKIVADSTDAIYAEADLPIFGDASDGDATIMTSSQTVGTWLTSGVMQRDAHLENLTFGAAGKIDTNGFRIFVDGVLDISSAQEAAITMTAALGGAGGGPGSGGVGATGFSSSVSFGGSGGGGNGGATGGGNTGTSTDPSNGGSGGSGGSGNGSGAGVGGTASHRTRLTGVLSNLLRGATLLFGGAGGGGGGHGNYFATNYVGGGGGGAGGGAVAIFAREIARGASTAAGAIQFNGGGGGNGNSYGGAGGGGGGGGGFVYIVCGTRSGTEAADAVEASGGGGGLPSATGNGGNGGNGGTITVIDLHSNTIDVVEGSAGSAAVQPNGGAGGACVYSL